MAFQRYVTRTTIPGPGKPETMQSLSPEGKKRKAGINVFNGV
jgi:hypothetical protein